MAANTAPIFSLTPVAKTVQVSVANAGRDGTGTLGTILTGGTNGTRIDKVNVKATVTTTAGMIRLFIDDLTNVRLWKEVPVDAITAAANTPAFEFELRNSDGSALVVIPSGYILKASTHNAEAINVTAVGGDY